MKEEAILLTTADPWTEVHKVAALLTFFGVASRMIATTEFLMESQRGLGQSVSYRVFSSVEGLLDLIKVVQQNEEYSQSLMRRIHSVFVHGSGSDKAITGLLQTLTNGGVGQVRTWQGEQGGACTIASEVDGFAGAMAGLSVVPSSRARPPRHVADLTHSSAIPLIASDKSATFFRLYWHEVPIHLCLTEEIVNLDEELNTPNFDLRDHFFAALPIVAHIRWAFPKTAWQAVEAGACLIIDDPLLKPRYGFVRFRPLLQLMKRHNFSTNIAFIPWNWKRSDPEIVSLFKGNTDRYSLSIHGCDHTAGEFGTDDASELALLTTTALDRMAGHKERTGLTHDQIMVFPQGVFSKTAMRELKRANFTAAVNTEVMCTGQNSPSVKISDVWDVALRRYNDFALYTRRYPRQGVENFAFDLLLGKPCLIVIHHNDCRNNCADIVEFMDRLNALSIRLEWRGLEDVVRRSYRKRKVEAAIDEIEMYGAEILVENPAPHATTFRIKRRETGPTGVAEIRADSDLVRYEVDGDELHFEISIPPGQCRLVTVRNISSERHGNGQVHSGLKTSLRRYLCEVRDNYVVPAKARLSEFSR